MRKNKGVFKYRRVETGVWEVYDVETEAAFMHCKNQEKAQFNCKALNSIYHRGVKDAMDEMEKNSDNYVEEFIGHPGANKGHYSRGDNN